MTPRFYLAFTGCLLLLLGILGYVGIVGPLSNDSIFGTNWWVDNGQSIVYIVVGLMSLLSAFVLRQPMIRKFIAFTIGGLLVCVGLLGIIVMRRHGMLNAGIAHLENPAETILHLVLGLWAVWVAIRPDKTSAPTPPQQPTPQI